MEKGNTKRMKSKRVKVKPRNIGFIAIISHIKSSYQKKTEEKQQKKTSKGVIPPSNINIKNKK